MTAIITDKIKHQFLEDLFQENLGTRVGDSDNFFYIGVARSQQWDPANNDDQTINPNTKPYDREERLFRYNMQSVKAVEAFSYVIPIRDWASGTEYAEWTDNENGHPTQSFYMRTVDNNVYVCLRKGRTSTGGARVSSVKPDHTSGLPIETDGYVWKYMYTITTANARSFLSTEFMPVEFVDSANPTDPNFAQFTVQNASIPGEIVGYEVQDGGGFYTSAPELTVVGNGTGASARAILNTAGAVTAVIVEDSDGAGTKGGADGTTPGGFGFGQNYDFASVTVSGSNLQSGGTAAKVVPVFAPKGGLGSNATFDFKATSLMFNIKPENDVDGTWITDNAYRQVALLKNIDTMDSAVPGSKFKGTSGTALYKMSLTSTVGNIDVTDGYAIEFDNSNRLYGADSEASAWLDYYDDDKTLWYHQDEYTGFTPFTSGEVITSDGYGGVGTLTIDSADIVPDVNRFSGEVLFINNQSKVTRDRVQTEDIKLVIRL